MLSVLDKIRVLYFELKFERGEENPNFEKKKFQK